MSSLLDLANLHRDIGVRRAALVLGDEALGADDWVGSEGREGQEWGLKDTCCLIQLIIASQSSLHYQHYF